MVLKKRNNASICLHYPPMFNYVFYVSLNLKSVASTLKNKSFPLLVFYSIWSKRGISWTLCLGLQTNVIYTTFTVALYNKILLVNKDQHKYRLPVLKKTKQKKTCLLILQIWSSLSVFLSKNKSWNTCMGRFVHHMGHLH